MKFMLLVKEALAIAAAGLAFASCNAQELPVLPNDLCDYDTIYDSIKTGNVVEVTLNVRYRSCPSNQGNKPCAASNSQGYAAGPILNGVQTDNSIVVNDEIPGPEIRASLGDTVRVTVVNYLGEPTTMHFHGITQFRTPFMDGDEMISNCPIPAGETHVYEFIAHPAGTTFYHSHSGSQRIAGMTGPLIIEDDQEPYADLPDKVLFLQDWYAQNADNNFEFWGQNEAPNCVTFGGDYFTGSLNPGRAATAGVGAVVGDGMFFQSFIVNGRGLYRYEETQVQGEFSLGDDPKLTYQEQRCPGQYSQAPQCEYCFNQDTWTSELCTTRADEGMCGEPAVIEVEAGVETRLRFAHAGGLFAAQVCIDGHSVDIITADGAPVQPYPTDCFLIFTAERYDAIIKPETAGDYLIRFTTADQQSPGVQEFAFPDATIYQGGFPHFGYAILRVTGSDGAEPTLLADFTPPSCDNSTTENCGSDYWLSSKTMGCAAGPSELNPDRCVTSFEALQPASSPRDDTSLCAGKKMPHEVDPTLKFTAALGFIPDEVPRWDGLGLNARIEIIKHDDGKEFPYITPQDPEGWGAHQPISFVNPDSPPLSLSAAEREDIYSYRHVFREINETNAAQNYPAYPKDFSRGVLGPNAVSVDYGDVVRVVFTCAEPYGPGCAMPHPMHLHGNKMAILYVGKWNETYDESKFNTNPLYRDTVTVNTDSFVVVQVAANNPGVWRWHCHVNIHHRGGMAMLLDVGGDSAAEAVRATPDDVNLCPTQPESATETDIVLPALPNDLCDYDTIYDSIKTGNVVEVTLHVRYRNCPSNQGNKPCNDTNHQGYAPGPTLNGVLTENSIVVNDEIPGPEIRAKLGDTVRVTVVNYLGEPTTMHFHGITQFRTPFMDGDEMISNCPIPDGHTHTYEFIAHPAGTTFYHSHSGSQRIAGMTGPLIIEDDQEPYADLPDKVLFLQDWYAQNADSNFEFWGQNMPPNCISFGGDHFTGFLNPRGIGSTADLPGAVVGDGMFFQSFIVNGRGLYQYEETQVPGQIAAGRAEEITFQEQRCPGQYSQAPQCEYCFNQSTWASELCTTRADEGMCGEPAVIEVEAGVETRLRFAHAGGLFAAQVCIDGHSVDIITADGAPVQPYPTDCFLIFTAERYDAIVKPETAGDYLIRFSTADQQTLSGGFNTTISKDGFPHFGYAILRVTGSDGADPLADFTPPSCDNSTTVNCGSDYWLSSKTMGCAAGPSELSPDRCVSSFEALQPASSPRDDTSLCAGKKMPHEVDPTVKFTARLGFIPDEVPRWEGLALNSRIEICTEEEWGFPYFTPDDPNDWGAHQPISFVNPGSPPLSLSAAEREDIYSYRHVFREINATNSPEVEAYPEDFSRGVLGPNAVSVDYGDVVRVIFTCAEPYGPGCAMPHPMHLHGNKMAILYVGKWDDGE